MTGSKSESFQGKLLDHTLSFEKNRSQRARKKRDCGKSYKKEEQMEATVKEKEETTVQEGKKGKGTWDHIYNFLAMGGFFLVLLAIVGIVVLISIIFK